MELKEGFLPSVLKPVHLILLNQNALYELQDNVM